MDLGPQLQCMGAPAASELAPLKQPSAVRVVDDVHDTAPN
jgi:hypothetical protein